jgi:hypothetical protein
MTRAWRQSNQRASQVRAIRVARVGRVSDLYLLTSNHHPKLITIDKQPDDDVMHLNRFGKADRLAGEPLDTGPQGQMPALDLLCVSLARGVLVGIEMTAIGPPIIHIPSDLVVDQ